MRRAAASIQESERAGSERDSHTGPERDRVLEASEYIPIELLGTTDDCGFSPFSDDTSTSRDTAFAKIQARVRGTALAGDAVGGRS